MTEKLTAEERKAASESSRQLILKGNFTAQLAEEADHASNPGIVAAVLPDDLPPRYHQVLRQTVREHLPPGHHGFHVSEEDNASYLVIHGNDLGALQYNLERGVKPSQRGRS